MSACVDFVPQNLSNPVSQVLDPQFGMYVWPCAVVLAQYLWMHREELRGKKVLEVSRSTHSDSDMWRNVTLIQSTAELSTIRLRSHLMCKCRALGLIEGSGLF